MIEVRYTDNLTSNLLSVEAFWDENQFPQGFDRLVDELTETVITNLGRHPRIGRNFLQRISRSIESVTRRQKLDALLQTLHINTETAEIREYVMTDYLLLYALVGDVIFLIALIHHKQLSFDINIDPRF